MSTITGTSFGEIVAAATRLNAECQYDEADALLWDLYKSGRQLPAALMHLLTLARDRGDWFGVVDRSADIRQRLPGNPAGYLKGIEAHRILTQFDKAMELLLDAKDRFSDGLLLLKEEARLAETQGDWKTVDSRMLALRESFPNDPELWILSAQFLIQAGRYGEAADMVRRALLDFPTNPHLHSILAIAVEKRHQWDEADSLWDVIAVTFPSHATFALQKATLWSRCSRDRKNYAETFERLALFHKAFPAYAAGYEAHVRLLSEVGQVKNAIQLADQTISLFPDNQDLVIAQARALAKDGKPIVAIDLLAVSASRLAYSPLIAAERAKTLAEAGRLDEADLVCRDACERFRYHPRPFVEYANIAEKRAALEDCLARWIDGAKRFPQHAIFQAGLAATHFSLSSKRNGDTDRSISSMAEAETSNSFRRFLLGFESLGGPGGGCELGVVQRRAGAEPLGLLRWGEISILNLRNALRDGFSGVGSPDQTDLIFHDDIEDYTIIDQRYNIKLHSFIRVDAIPRDQILYDSCARLSFLRKKLLRDLDAGTKIFVFRLGGFLVDLEPVLDLYEAFQKTSKSTLLCVGYAEANSDKLGQVEQLRSNLLLGYTEALEAWGVTNFSRWHQVCHSAHDLTRRTGGVI